MHKKLIYTLIISFLAGCQLIKETNKGNQMPAPDFAAFEMLKTKNPVTGRVNPADLIKAWQQIELQFGQQKLLNKREIYPYGWHPVDDNLATLSISKIVYDPNNTSTFYFCTGEGWFNADAARGAGVWKSTDGGKNWQVLPATLNDSFYYCQDILVHPVTSDIYVATLDGGLQRSKDGGTSWQRVLGAGNGSLVNRMADLELTADNEIMISAGIFQSDGIYFSATGDQGSWQKRMNGIPNSVHRIEIATAPSDANVAYCIPTSSDADRKITGVYRTSDKGLTWNIVSFPGGDKELAKIQGWYDLIITVDPNDANVAVAGGLNLWKTKDGGNSWTQLCEGDFRSTKKLQYVHVDQHEVVFKNSDTVFFGNDGGIYMSTNFTSDSVRMFDVNKNYNVTQYYSCAMGPHKGDQRVLGGTQDNGTYMSTAAGISDFTKLSWADGGFCAVNHENGNTIFTTTQERRIYRTRGTAYDSISNPLVKDANTLFINPLEMDASDAEMIYQGSNQGLWRLANASYADSTQWQLSTRPWGQISAIATSKAKPKTVFLGRTNGGKVYRVDNVHLTDKNYFPVNLDQKGTLPADVYTSCVAISQNDASHALVVYSNYGVPSIFESKNVLTDTASWTNVEGDLPDMPVRWAIFHPDNEAVCYIATELGVFYTEKLDGSNTKWKPAGAGLPNIRIDMIRYRASDKTFLIATHGRGLYTAVNKAGSYEFEYTERGPRNIGGRTRAIMVDPNDPTGRKLWAGSVSGGLWVTENIDSAGYFVNPQPVAFNAVLFPNPTINNKTSLKIEVPQSMEVSAKLYDGTGNLVRVLIEDTIEDEWTKEIDFSGMAHEVYFIRVISGKEEKSFKVVVE